MATFCLNLVRLNVCDWLCGFAPRRSKSSPPGAHRTRCRQFQCRLGWTDANWGWMRIRGRSWRPTGPFRPAKSGRRKASTSGSRGAISTRSFRTATRWRRAARSVRAASSVGAPPARGTASPARGSCRTIHPGWTPGLPSPTASCLSCVPGRTSFPSAERSGAIESQHNQSIIHSLFAFFATSRFEFLA